MKQIKKVSPTPQADNMPHAQSTLDPVGVKHTENSSPQVGNDHKVVKEMKMGSDKKMIYIVIGLFVGMMGVGTGWALANQPTADSPIKTKQAEMTAETSDVEVDNELFPDNAEGYLVEGGINGEGTHKLERGMGPEKDVYLLSTVLDLDSYVGKKVEIWGKTISSQQAGWLIDVGKVRVLE